MKHGKILSVSTGLAMLLASASIARSATWICPPLRTETGDVCRCSIANYDTRSSDATITIYDETGVEMAGPFSPSIPPNGNVSLVATPGPTRCGCRITHTGSKTKFAASLSTKSTIGDEKAVECR